MAIVNPQTVKNSLLKAISYMGVPRIYYARKRRLKSYFLHRVVSEDHPYFEYHIGLDHLSVPTFEAQLRYIMKFNRIVSLEEYDALVSRGEPVRENLVLLTFDDGYRCLYKNVFPILQKYRVPAVVFVTAQCVEHQAVPFHDDLLHTLIKGKGKRTVVTLAGSPVELALNDVQSICSAYGKLSRHLKSVPDRERHLFLQSLMKSLSVEKRDISLPDEMLTWDQLREMHASGLLAIGAHTMTHPILSKVEPGALPAEIVASKELIERRLGISVTSFAYPNGRLNDVNQPALELVRNHFSLSFCTLGHPWDVDRHLITRQGFEFQPGYLPLVDCGLVEPFASYRLSATEAAVYLDDPLRLTIPERLYR